MQYFQLILDRACSKEYFLQKSPSELYDRKWICFLARVSSQCKYARHQLSGAHKYLNDVVTIRNWSNLGNVAKLGKNGTCKSGYPSSIIDNAATAT